MTIRRGRVSGTVGMIVMFVVMRVLVIVVAVTVVVMMMTPGMIHVTLLERPSTYSTEKGHK